MRRPFFYLAIFLSILILIFHTFIKEDRFFAAHISNFASNTPRDLSIKGRVISDPYYKYTYFKKAQVFIVNSTLVKVSKIWFPACGNILIKSYSDKELKYGDEILFEAKLKLPSRDTKESFNYKRYLERNGIYAIATISLKDTIIIIGKKVFPLKSFAYRLKGILKCKLQNLFKAPERYFLSAILLGERQDISEEWRDIFMKTQTMHLLAISGLHVGMIAFIILFFVGLFAIPRNFRYTIAIILLIFYALMVGGRPSIVRATVMAVAILSSYLLKKDADIYNTLGFAATVILIFNPDQLFDYGFVLSFASVLSIIYMTPGINYAFRVDKIDRNTYVGRVMYYFSNLASASFAVWLGLLPITINLFNIISPISLLANILAIPLFFVIIALSISALIFQMIFYFLGIIFAEATKFFIVILLSSLRLFSKMPLAYLEMEKMDIFQVLLYYCTLIIIFERARLRKYLLR